VLGRFLNMGVEPYNFVSALNCIMAQRLVRTICEACKRPAKTPPPELIEESGLKSEEWKHLTYYEGAGCQECNETGFRGRTAIGELLALSDNIRELILEKRTMKACGPCASRRWRRFSKDLRLCGRSIRLRLSSRGIRGTGYGTKDTGYG